MTNKLEKTFKIGLLLAFAMMSLFLLHKVNAQESNSRGISLSPIHYEFSADPGDVINEKIKIHNPTDSTFSVNMETEDFEPVGDEGQVIVRENNNARYSLKRWVTVSPDEFVLGPKEERFVSFSISVPQNADPGGKYGSILAVMGANTETGQTGSIISQKIGALVLLSVSGPVTESLKVKDIKVAQFSEYGPIPFAIRFENKGTVHVKPRGFLTVTDMLGRKTDDLEIEGQNVIPGAIRKVGATLEKKWLFGKYSARLIGDYGRENIPLDSPVVYFWVIPWKITLAVLILTIVLIWIIYRSRKRLMAAFRILISGKEQ